MPSDDESGSSSLTVGGPGSVTFRVPQSQLVKAHGEWKDGRWTVVMTRSLAVASDDDGVSLSPGRKASMAFAIWNGSQKDRDGKKLVTVWQDLVLEGDDGSIPEAPPSLVKKPTPVKPTSSPEPKDQTAKIPDPPPSVTPTPSTDGAWGNLRGRFVYDGIPPTPAKANVNKDADVCGKHNLIKESLLVNKENRGLANVVVYMYVPRGKDQPPVHPSYAQSAKSEVPLNNSKCRFEPHVTLLRTSQTLLISNRDPVGHNTKIDTQVNPPINPNTPAGEILKQHFSAEERTPAMVSCSVHSWMSGWILVRELPYFARTDTDGNF
ncbi:MAG: hypothetical protein IH991_20290, partial [Planctomycetes bacterium]|nr:hypothetical protein [Planctomycetota bacterium]